MTNYDEYDTYWQNSGYKKISDIIFAERHIFIFLIFDTALAAVAWILYTKKRNIIVWILYAKKDGYYTSGNYTQVEILPGNIYRDV